MRFTKKPAMREKDVTIGGITKTVTVEDIDYEPIVPRDWDRITTNVGMWVVGGLTLVSIAWSTWSIGDLLGQGLVGFAAAILFDLGWAMCLLLEWKSRYDPRKRKAPKFAGWALLLLAMGFIFWHGVHLGSVALAVVGAAFSLVAKVLWLMVMQHVNIELEPEHQAWVKAMISEANAQKAVAEVTRMSARVEDDSLAQRLAIEMSRQYLPDSVRNEHLGQRPDSVLTGPDTPGHTSDSVRPVPMLPVLTGPDGFHQLSGQQVDGLDNSDTTSDFVRTAVHYGMTEYGDIVAWADYLNKEFKADTLRRTYQREMNKQ